MINKLASICMLVGMTAIWTTAQAESLVDGSIEAGKAKAATCAACHGAEGNSVNPEWPNLAGQNASYLVATLHAFKNQERSNPLMLGQVMSLSDEDIRNLAVYYESLPGAAQPVADPALIDRGEALYRGGNAENRASACIACHGPTGRGNPAAAYPDLHGQHAVYTAKQLRDYASGARQTVAQNKTKIMQEIAERLSEDDIVALASYIQGLR